MTRGRKPKPSALVELSGNAGERSKGNLKAREGATLLHGISPGDFIPAPGHLPGAAAEEWAKVVALLAEVGLLAKTDLRTVEQWCVACADFEEACHGITDTGGHVIAGDKGGLVVNPWVKIRNDASALMLKLGGELGLTPISRTRLHTWAAGYGGSTPDNKRLKRNGSGGGEGGRKSLATFLEGKPG